MDHNIAWENIYTIVTADVLTYIIHHVQERKNTIYPNEYYTSGQSSPREDAG